jgi:hypothetical protein
MCIKKHRREAVVAAVITATVLMFVLWVVGHHV